jgi:hypothetical protein
MPGSLESPVDFEKWPRLCSRDFTGLSAGSLQVFLEVKMSSRTGKTRNARKVRQARKGKARKRKDQNKGTTPKFPIHLDG